MNELERKEWAVNRAKIYYSPNSERYKQKLRELNKLKDDNKSKEQ